MRGGVFVCLDREEIEDCRCGEMEKDMMIEEGYCDLNRERKNAFEGGKGWRSRFDLAPARFGKV